MILHTSISQTGLPYNIPLGAVTLSLYGEAPWGVQWGAWAAMLTHEQREERPWVPILSSYFMAVESLSLFCEDLTTPVK